MRGLGQRSDQHQRVWDAVGRQQQRQLVQKQSAGLILVASARGGENHLMVPGCGRHNEREQSQAFVQTNDTGLHLRQTQYELEGNTPVIHCHRLTAWTLRLRHSLVRRRGGTMQQSSAVR